MATDYYEILGIERTATDDDIKRAYRQLARTHHPDVARDKAQAENVFKDINEAYAVLSDPEKRRNYDRYGKAGVNGAGAGFSDFPGFGEGFGDIFDMFFGAARGGPQGAQRRHGPARGSDLRYDIQITLEEAFSGTQRDIAFNHLASCGTCKGSGAKPGTLITACDRCNGSGVMRQVRQTPLGQFVTQTTCTKCNGDGQMIPQPCETCQGRGRVEAERTLSVRIPAGVDDGSRIRIAGSGEAGMRGGPAGDLYVYLTVTRHQRFRRDGLDIAHRRADLVSAGGAGRRHHGPVIGRRHPAFDCGPARSPAQRIACAGAACRAFAAPSRGDQLVTVHVIVPSKLSKRERELLEEYARAGGDRIEDEKSFFERVKDAFRAD